MCVALAPLGWRFRTGPQGRVMELQPLKACFSPGGSKVARPARGAFPFQAISGTENLGMPPCLRLLPPQHFTCKEKSELKVKC